MGNAEVVITGISNQGTTLFRIWSVFVMEDNPSPIIRRDEIASLRRDHPTLVRVIIDLAI